MHRRSRRLLHGFAVLALALFAAAPAAQAQQSVVVPSLDGTALPGYLWGKRDAGSQPAVLLLHGCGGMLNRRGHVNARTTAWAGLLADRGYAALAIDSFTPRGVHGMCVPRDFVASVYAARPRDAYGALLWLQRQPGIIPGRIAVIGWSEGGGVVLSTIRTGSPGRPATLPQGGFRAAVAFYPARCSRHRQGASWQGTVPLLVLIGSADVWTRAAPCQRLIGAAAAGSAPASIVVYPGAYHDFDWPGMRRHESPQFRTASGVVPIQGNDPEAMADARRRVGAFLDRWIGP